MVGIGRYQALKSKKKEGIHSNTINKHFSQIILMDKIIIQKQPRENFNEIDSLASSIKEHGLFNPLTVMENINDNNTVILVSGERRFRAYQELGKTKIPCIVFPFSDDKEDLLSKQVVENIQREDLSLLEKVTSIYELKNMGVSVDNLSKKLGLHKRSIYRYLKINELPDEIKNIIIKNQLSLREVVSNYFSKKNTSSKYPSKREHFISVNKQSMRVYANKIMFSGINKSSKETIQTTIKEFKEATKFLETTLKKL